MIEEFRSSFTQDLAKPSRFDVKIALPDFLNGITDSKTLSFRCENASLPGRSLATTDLKIYGPVEKFPYQTNYDDITLTFIVSDSMTEKLLFSSWLNHINPYSNWNFHFKKEYCVGIEVTQYDQADNEVMTVVLVDAFPIAVNQLDLDWSNDSSYHKLSVTFAYTYWYTAATANRNHAVGISKNEMQRYPQPDYNQAKQNTTNPIALGALLEIGSLAYSAGKALSKGNPYAVLGVAGAATSIIPSLGSTKTLSSIINSQGRGVLDTKLDVDASTVNKTRNTIQGLKSKINTYSA